MKNITLAFALWAFGATITHAQDSKTGAHLSEIRKNKNQIDLDVKNLFNGLSGATLLYKRSYQTGDLIDVSAIKLIRFSASINNQVLLGEKNIPWSAAANNIDLQIGVGIEKQVMHNGFVHYYGADLVAGYYNSNAIFNTIEPGGILVDYYGNQVRGRSIRAGLNPFFGIKYYFTSRLSIGLETGMSLMYFHASVTEQVVTRTLVNNQIIYTNVYTSNLPASSGFQTRFNNLRFLTVGYTF
ncbi:MAG: hypothetical protein ACKVU2_02230 [Saprospiraceae bacterium]